MRLIVAALLLRLFYLEKNVLIYGLKAAFCRTFNYQNVYVMLKFKLHNFNGSDNTGFNFGEACPEILLQFAHLTFLLNSLAGHVEHFQSILIIRVHNNFFFSFSLQWPPVCYPAFLLASSHSGGPSLPCLLLLLLLQQQLLVLLMLHKAAQRPHRQQVRVPDALLQQITFNFLNHKKKIKPKVFAKIY